LKNSTGWIWLSPAAAKGQSVAPPQAEIFEALAEAAIVCADAIEASDDKPISTELRAAFLLLQVAITDLAATLKTYPKLVV
jgi:hypothetical protein